MASRQNRKKKGKANPQNRERIVTTLVEDPSTESLVPTPEETAAVNMSSPFSVSSSSGGGPSNNAPNGNHQIHSNFGYSGPSDANDSNNGFNGHIAGPNTQFISGQNYPQQYYRPPLPAGSSDLEILEKLKAQIKSGQHTLYQPEPRPADLYNVYVEGLQADAVYAQQGVSAYQGAGSKQMGYDVGSANNFKEPRSAQLPRLQTKEFGDVSNAGRSIDSSPVGASQATSKVPSTSNQNTYFQSTDTIRSQNNQPSRYNPNSVPPSPITKTAGSHDLNLPTSSTSTGNQPTPPSRYGGNNSNPKNQDSVNQNNDQRRPPGVSPVISEYGSRTRASSDASPSKVSVHEIKEDTRNARNSAWQPTDGARDDKRPGPEPDRPMAPAGRPGNWSDSRPNGNELRDQRFYDREHERDRERERERDGDRDRDRRPDFRRDDRPRMTNAPRPPPEQRHYEPRYASDLPRRLDDMDMNKRPLPAVIRPALIDDRGGRGLPPLDDRAPPPRAPLPDSRAVPISPGDRHDRRPPVTDSRHGLPLEGHSIRNGPPHPKTEVMSPRLGGFDRDTRVPPPLADDRSSRPVVPLEDRIGRTPPSLQDRIGHPPPSRANDRMSRRPSLEERISHAPIPPVDRSAQHDDRSARPIPVDRVLPPRVADLARPPVQGERIGRPDDRTGRPGLPADRYARPLTPPHDRVRAPGHNVPPPPSASLARDDSRALRVPSSPPPRDYRSARAASPPRDRDLRPAHRPDDDRPYDAVRRSDAMDIDVPPRFNDPRPPYQRRASPPPAIERAKGIYPPPSPPRAETPFLDTVDRRYAPAAERRDYPLEDRQRQYSAGDDDAYYKSRPQTTWDRAALDKDRAERGAPPVRTNGGWETREERERRSSFPGSPASRSFEGAPPPRATPSRLGEGYPRPPDDRTYPPRDTDRQRYPPAAAEPNPATFTRVRQRSPSPMGRRLGPGVVDDGRPPNKRPREEATYSADYYSAQLRGPPLPVPPSSARNYPPSAVPSSRSSSDAYFDSRTVPPTPAAGRNGAAPYDRDYHPPRDVRLEPIGYTPGPATYERPPRSPPPAPYRPPYRPTDSRDDRRYSANIPPPVR